MAGNWQGKIGVWALLLGVVGRLSGDTRWGVLSIVLLFLIGAYLLSRVEPS